MSDVTTSYGVFLDFIAFLRIFIHIEEHYSCLKYFIFAKLSQIVNILKMSNLTTSYGRFSDLIDAFFLRIFTYYYLSDICYNFIKLLKTLCSHYFCNFRKKGPRPKWTIYKHLSDNSKKCLSIGNFRILYVVCHLSSSVVVWSASTAYTSLW